MVTSGGRVTGVRTSQGDIRCDYVVNCAGLWARTLGRRSGVNIPLHACEHYYAVTEKLPDLPDNLPVMRDHDKCAYYKPDAGSLLVGAFEKKAVAWGQNGIPADFSFDELEGHMEEQLMPVLEDAMASVPMLADTGWRKFFCGPESFTPDDQFHVGEAPEVENYFVAAGLNSIGIQSAGGLGKALAEWMVEGHPPLDLWGNDIRRMHPFQGTQHYIQNRVTETLGLLYDNHYPYRQMETSRDVRHSPVHERLVAHNACFGESAGWERPNWFAPEGVEPRYEYGFGKQNWFGYSAAEHRAAQGGRGPVRPEQFRQVPRPGPGCLQGPSAHLQRQCRPATRAHGLHPLAQSERGYRGGSHRDPALRRCVFRGQRRRGRGQGHELAAPAHTAGRALHRQ